MHDPMMIAAMSARQPDPITQQQAAMAQAGICLDAAKFILEHGPLFSSEVQQQAQSFITRCLIGLDNIRIQPPPQAG